MAKNVDISSISKFITPGKEKQAQQIANDVAKKSSGSSSKNTNSKGQTAPIGANDQVTSENYQSVLNYLSPYMTQSAQNTVRSGGQPVSYEAINQMINSPVTTTDLTTPVAPIKIPEVPLYKPTTAVVSPVEDTTAQDNTALQNAQMVANFMGDAQPEQINRQKIEKQTGLTAIKARVNSLASEIGNLQAQNQADIQLIRNQSSSEGGTMGILSAREDATNRSYAAKILPLNAQYQSELGNQQMAQDLVDTYIADENAYQDRLYSYKKDLGNMFLSAMNTDQQRRWDLQDQANAVARDEAKSNNSWKQQAWEQATANGQTSLAAKILGLDSSSPYFMSELENYTSRLSTPIASTDTSGLTEEQKADPFVAKMLATKGGKPMTDTFMQSLNKGLNVLGQIGGLQTTIQDVKTGPIIGAFKGANPWDTNAQVIKAQLNAIVPNLARGVYGEVGVLTDNDIAQYSKTLPNLKSTEDIRNAVLGITVDLIGKNIKRTLEVNAANGKDVSGFVDIYTEMEKTRDSIFSQIPGYKGTGQTSEAANMSNEDLLGKINNTISSWSTMNNNDFFNQLP